MPATGGGATTMTRPSWIGASRLNSSPWMTVADLRGSEARSANGSSVTKMAPAFGAVVNVAPENPTMFTAWATPGTPSAMSAALRLTASVRPSEAPGGSCVTMIKYPRSSCGMNPIGVLRNSLSPKARMPA